MGLVSCFVDDAQLYSNNPQANLTDGSQINFGLATYGRGRSFVELPI